MTVMSIPIQGDRLTDNNYISIIKATDKQYVINDTQLLWRREPGAAQYAEAWTWDVSLRR